MPDGLYEQYRVQSALTQEQGDNEKAVNSSYILQQQQQVQAALVEQTNPVHVLEDVELKLKGMERTWDGKVKRRGDPIMNEKGISRILFILSSIINQNTILSHLEDGEIAKMIVKVADDIVDDLALNWKEYDVKDKIMLDYIVDGAIFPAFMALKRAWKQNEKNWLNRAVVESINTSPRYMPQKKEGIWSKFKL